MTPVAAILLSLSAKCYSRTTRRFLFDKHDRLSKYALRTPAVATFLLLPASSCQRVGGIRFHRHGRYAVVTPAVVIFLSLLAKCPLRITRRFRFHKTTVYRSILSPFQRLPFFSRYRPRSLLRRRGLRHFRRIKSRSVALFEMFWRMWM